MSSEGGRVQARRVAAGVPSRGLYRGHAPRRSKWGPSPKASPAPQAEVRSRCRKASRSARSMRLSAVRFFSHSCPPIHTRGGTLRLPTDAEDRAMPSKSAIQRARKDKREGKSPSTQAGEFVREEIEHVREGKHGARSTKQAIAIGLSEARSAGVDVPAKGKAAKKSSTKKAAAKKSSTKKPSTKKSASKKAVTKKAASKKTARKSSETKATRSRAATKALKKEGSAAASKRALSRQGHQAAAKRSAADRSAAAKKAARTKGAKGRSAAAKKAARTRARGASD